MKTTMRPFPILACLALTSAAAAADAPATRLELPGVVADRTARTVRIEARACGVAAGTTTEFYLIAPNSGHNYESVAVSRAKALDVRRALEFIGLPAGRPVNPDLLHFWPRGEAVNAFVEWTDATAGATNAGPQRMKLEDTIVDKRTGKPASGGFLFTGSVEETVDGRRVFAADEYEPNSIVSAYNLAATVLDIPRRGSQAELYDYQVANPEHLFKADTPLTIVLEPASPPGAPSKPLDLDLVIRAPADAAADVPRFTLGAPKAPPLLENGSFSALQEALARAAGADRLPFLTVRIEDDVRLRLLKDLPPSLGLLVEQQGARIEPAPTGHLYYLAFAPNPAFRERGERPRHPWELRLKAGDKGLEGTLVKVENTRDLLTDDPTFKVTEFKVATPAELRATVEREGRGLAVMLVFAPPSLTYGEVAAFLRPVLDTHPIIHLFMD